ncbi:hypothetical protein SC499_20265 [Peribacillus simplex]|uniref:hypothetical protein n=1 Tax=Peribacillus simplex TaxID=1478 RepID=UPI00298DAE59|nr:hypothetical protein [Peribacillus simplex]MDW7616985.1 hypothetical protein [Peribacillus simplex]
MKVYVIATDDPCWENETNDYPMFGDDWTVQLREGFLNFQKITGELANGVPVLDIATCPRFEILWDDEEIPDLTWLREATFMEVMEKFAK